MKYIQPLTIGARFWFIAYNIIMYVWIRNFEKRGNEVTNRRMRNRRMRNRPSTNPRMNRPSTNGLSTDDEKIID